MNTSKNIAKRLIKARAELIERFPFFGRLLLRLNFGLAKCGTAYTDMQNIVFDPDYANRLSDAELEFVLLHEVYHCVLKHCTRGEGLQHFLYNVACDIVVNSYILETLGVSRFFVDKGPVMHTAPNGKEGRKYTAEEVYQMLLEECVKAPDKYSKINGCDTHAVWERLAKANLEQIWNKNVYEAAKAVGIGTGIPSNLKRYFNEVRHEPRNNWRHILHDFIQSTRFDYSFSSPDRRYQGDIIIPSFADDGSGSSVDDLWFLIDTSGSVSSPAIAEAYNEIRQATEQIDNLSGMLSFFDTVVSKPVNFDSVDELMRIEPIGGGGTSFKAIFDSVDDFFPEKPPRSILIITDGHAPFPDESAAKNIPVFWIIADSNITPPWGEKIHISSE